MWNQTQQARLEEIDTELKRMSGYKSHQLSDKQSAHMERLVDEGYELVAKRDTHKAALRLAGSASPAEYGMSNVNPGDGASGYSFASQASKSVINDPREQKAAEHGLAARKHIGPSPYLMSDKQMRDIYAAGRSNMSFGTTIGKGADSNMDLIHKTVSEGAVGSLLPPILLPNAFPLRLEPTRIAEYFPAVNAEGQAITFLQHRGNTLAASGAGMSVAENAEKPELGMNLQAVTVPFSVVAAIEPISKQMWTDFESVAEFLPREISNQVIQGENYQIISGSGTTPDQTGLLHVSGTLTRAFTSGGSDTEIDTILEAANDIRVGPSYANADLVILNPQDWLSLRQIKTTFDSYVLKQNDPGELGGIDHLFQLRVAQTTSIPQGTALVLDTSIAVNIFRRWGLTVEVNPWAGDEFKANQLIVRAETRFGVGCIYPKAVCKVTNLFPPAS
jgi:HK97 family phage major capsid protein